MSASTIFPQSAEQSSIPSTTDISDASTSSVTIREVSILLMTSMLVASKAGSFTLSPASISSPSDTSNGSPTGSVNTATNTAQAIKQPVPSNVTISGIAGGGAIALLILIWVMWVFSRRRAHKRQQEEWAKDKRTRKASRKSMWGKYWKSELPIDTEIREVGGGTPQKIELGAYENEIRELGGAEAATELATGRPRLTRGRRELAGSAVSVELPS
ncbi:hypothetical protein MMC18_006837 [Xylographa bjoerkii]|nr:hypothetical protein [Xylographa bjoerkii]